MIRRHRILESYLTSKLGYDWGDVHVEAERLEHAVSEKLIERMADALGEPRYDPHGAPIPTAAGRSKKRSSRHWREQRGERAWCCRESAMSSRRACLISLSRGRRRGCGARG